MIMKKYFIFAAVAAAGLLTSCSSSDDVAANEGQLPESPDGRPAIQIGVGSAKAEASTRGTGSVGGMNDYVDASTVDPNIWRGERVHVLMYEIKEDATLGLLPTFNFTKENNSTTTNLYDDQSILVTPLIEENLADGIAKEPTDPNAIGNGETYKVKYYPISGQSDFWGYYLGGYGTGSDAPAGSGTITPYTYTAPTAPATSPTLAAAQSTDDADVMATDFTIDGTHDLMVGQAPIADNGTYTKFRYSAKAARQNIQPNIAFKHLLSRLKFKAVAGNAKANGVRVSAIKVRSKDTGKMIVAYKYKDDQGADVAEPTRIAWDATQEGLAYDATTLPQLSLKQRASFANDTYQGAAYAAAHDALLVSSNLNVIFKFSDAYKKVIADQNAHYKWEAATETIVDTYAAETYDAGNHDGELIAANEGKIYLFSDGAKKVIEDPANAGQYIWEAASVDATNAATAYTAAHDVELVAANDGKIYLFSDGAKKVVVDNNTYYVWEASTSGDYDAAVAAGEKMKDLTPVAMEWAATTPGTLGATTTYGGAEDFAASTLTAITGSGSITDKAALDALTSLTETDGDYKAATADGKYYIATVTGGDVTASVEMTGSASYATAKGSEIDNTTLANLTAAENDAKTKAQGDYFYATTDGKYYKINVATGAVGGGVAKEIGEALLVAPQAKYDIVVEYEMDTYTARQWYKGYPTDLTPGDDTGATGMIGGTLHTDLVRTQQTTPGTPDAFEAGASYLVTITLYGPEEIVINTTLTKWTQGDQDIAIGQD